VSTPIHRVVTAGLFTLDGQSFDVENNVWLVGEDSVVVVDAAHDAAAIVTAVGGRPVTAVVCTHGHNDHVNAAVDLADRVDAPIYLHPADRMLWDAVHPLRAPDRELTDGVRIGPLEVLHTPGHSPGSVCGLPGQTRVLTGHGDSSSVETEAPGLAEWRARGH